MKRLLLIGLLAGCNDIENVGYTGGAGTVTPGSPLAPPLVGVTPAVYATLATGPSDVMALALDDTYVYWVVNHQFTNESDVFRVAKTGGPSEHVTHVDGRVYSFALDDTYVYLPVWDQSDAGAPFLRVAKSGGIPEVIDDHFRYLDFVAVHDDGVYLAPLIDEPTVDYQLWRYPFGSGPHEVLVDGLRGPESLAIASSKLYVTTAGDSLFHEAPLAGGAHDEPVPSLYALHALSDGDRVYFMSGAYQECTSARVSAWRPGSTGLTDLGAVPSCASAFALTSSSILAVNVDAHALFEYPLDGSGRQTLVSGLGTPSAIAAEPDGSTIFWGDFYTGEIDRLDRAP